MHGSHPDWRPSLLLGTIESPLQTLSRFPDGQRVWLQRETAQMTTQQIEVASVDETAQTGAEPGAQ